MFRFGLSDDGKTLTANKFEGFEAEERPAVTESFRVAVVLDVETTGLDSSGDEVIEIGARKIGFDKDTGKVVWVGDSFQALQEVDRPLSEFVKRLTGLRDEDLEGKKIDWEEFDSFIAEAVIIIAHNASFDRPFVDKHSKASREKIWGCSSVQIDWDQWFSGRKQEYLTLCHGFFCDAHRGLNDVDALIHLLSFSLPEDDSRTYLAELLQNAKKPMWWIYAKDSPFETKDVLKKNRYKWTGSVWRKRVREDELSSEKAFLASEVYSGKGFLGKTEKISLKDSFKA